MIRIYPWQNSPEATAHFGWSDSSSHLWPAQSLKREGPEIGAGTEEGPEIGAGTEEGPEIGAGTEEGLEIGAGTEEGLEIGARTEVGAPPTPQSPGWRRPRATRREAPGAYG